ncbi:MAG: HAMP domain-containing histidine kinase [Pseudobutyrivibrio sp.]|nr:HAMP domain-containing histidine kinase [Pseudobutyrivibrio sp.]
MRYLLGLSIFIIVMLSLKIIVMRKSVRELRADFVARGNLDTNSLIGIPSRDKELRLLVNDMNKTLSKLREAFHKYNLGDNELKTAITNVTHDIRTPLTAIMGYLELAKKQEMTPETAKYLAIIEERCHQMKKLTEELFEYSVVSTTETKEELTDVCVNKVLEDCLMNYYAALMEKGIEPVIEICEDKVISKLYPSYVERIFSNLISNALKYSDGDLYVSLSPDGTVIFKNSASALTSVAVDKLFDRFFTVETAMNESTGLGLSIVKTFAQRMGCDINAKYEDGSLIIQISNFLNKS